MKFKSLLFAALTIFAWQPKSFSQDVQNISQFSGLNSDDSTLALVDGQSPDSQNVITDKGGLQGRKGFIQFSTQSAVDIFEFPLSNGTRYMIKRDSTRLLADTGSGTFSTVVSTIPSDRKTVATVLGDKFYFMNTTDGLKYWDGSTITVASRTISGTMLVTFKGRLAVGGIGGQERVLRLSKYLDGTSWTAPANATDDDAAIITIAGSLDENIQAIYSTFQDKLIWFKKNSFGGIFGSRRSNFIQRTFSDTTGVSAPETIQDCDGYLRWLGNNRKVWEFDGNTYYKISDQVNNLFTAITQGDAATRSLTLTSKGDWDQGTDGNSLIPSGNLSTSISPGSIVLSTMAVMSSSDTSAADFSAGTLVSLDSSTIPGSLILGLGSESEKDNLYGAGGQQQTACSPAFVGQQFTAGSSYLFTSVTVSAKKVGSPGDYSVIIFSDNSNTIGTQLASGSFPAASIGSSFSDVNLILNTSIPLTSGTKYWIKFISAGTCDTSLNVFSFEKTLGAVSEFNTLNGSTYNQLQRFQVKTLGKNFNSSGSIVSRNFDVGFTTNTWLFNLSTLTASMFLPTGSTVTFQTQSSNDGVTFDTLTTAPINTVSTTTARQKFRYKASFSTSDTSTSPVLNDVTLNYGPFLKSSGAYTSKLVNVGSNISSWGPVTIGNNVSSGGSMVFQVGSTNTASISAITNWTAITNNSVPTIPVSPYAAFRSTFSATRSTDSLTLDDFTFSWTEGSTLRPASGYIDQRYWLSVATNSSTNNIIYVYDRKKQWQRYSGLNADCLGKYNSALYFGNSTGIFQTEQGYSDAGSDITAYYKTKDYALSGPDTPTFHNYTYLSTDQSDGMLSSSYQLNGSTTPIALGTYQMNQPLSLQNFKIPFPNDNAVQGKFINLKWSVIGTDLWRIISGNIYHDKGTEPD